MYTGPRRCHNCGQVSHLVKDCPRLFREKAAGVSTPREKMQKQDGAKCYNCGRRGHISSRCPSNTLFWEAKQRPVVAPQKRDILRSGLVEGKTVTDIVLDTGCSKTRVRQDLVPAGKFVALETSNSFCHTI